MSLSKHSFLFQHIQNGQLILPILFRMVKMANTKQARSLLINQHKFAVVNLPIVQNNIVLKMSQRWCKTHYRQCSFIVFVSLCWDWSILFIVLVFDQLIFWYLYKLSFSLVESYPNEMSTQLLSFPVEREQIPTSGPSQVMSPAL